MNLTIISGPTRSGKSQWAEHLLKGDGAVTYLATALNPDDDKEWLERIVLHKKRRPKSWSLIESKGQLAEDIEKVDTSQ